MHKYVKIAVPIIWGIGMYALFSTLSENPKMEHPTRHEFRARQEIAIHKGIEDFLRYDSNNDGVLDRNELRDIVHKNLMVNYD